MLESPDPIKRLMEEPAIIRPHMRTSQHLVGKSLAKKGYNVGDVNIVATIDDSLWLYQAVRQGLGLAVASQLMASRIFRDDEVLLYTLEDVYKEIYVVMPDDVELTTLSNKFIDMLKRFVY